MAPLEVYVTFYSDEKQKTDRKDRTHMWHEFRYTDENLQSLICTVIRVLDLLEMCEFVCVTVV